MLFDMTLKWLLLNPRKIILDAAEVESEKESSNASSTARMHKYESQRLMGESQRQSK